MRKLITVAALLGLGAMLNFFALPWLMEMETAFFLHVFASPGLQLQEFLAEGPTTLFAEFWFCNVGALLVWFGWTMQRPAASATKVAAMRGKWYMIAFLLVVVGWICIFFRIWFPFREVSLSGIILLLALLLVDEAFLFWLPTALASPRSYRLVAPGAQLFQKT